MRRLPILSGWEQVRYEVIVCLSLLATVPLFAATPTTGSLSGRVSDPSGTPLPGVTVTVSGSNLPGFRTTPTDDRGEYRFTLLPPGHRYRLEAALEGFGRVVVESVSVSLGRDASLNLTLRPAAFDEITVTATPPLIDFVNATASTNITREQIDALPTRRDFQQLAILAPQTVFDRDALNPAIAGATHLENDYIIEGVSTRDPRNAKSATNLTMNFVEEIQVATSGLSAEHGRAMGGVISVLTRSGGNEFRGSLLGYYNDADWNSKNVIGANRGSHTYDLGRDKKDIGVSLGGPFLRDRIWFFAAANPRRDVTPIRLVDAQLSIDRRERITEEERVFAGKLTATLSARQTLIVSAFGNPILRSGWQAGVRTAPSAALSTSYSGSRNLAVQYHAAPTSRMAAEFTAGRHRQHLQPYRPDTEEGRLAPSQTDNPARFTYGGLALTQYDETVSRDSLAVRGSYFARPHEIRFGADVERNRYDLRSVDEWFTYFGKRKVNDEVGTRDVMFHYTLDNRGYGSNNGSALFLQDRWQPTPNVSITAGLRWERQTLGSAQGAAIAVGHAPDGTLIRRSADSFTFDHNWAPRFGLAWDVAARGNLKLYASAGRYFESIPVIISVHAMNGFGFGNVQYYSTVPYSSDTWYNPKGSPLNSNWIEIGREFQRWNSFGTVMPGPVPIASDAKLQYQDEWSLGTEYQFGTSWVAGARVIGREMHRVIEDLRVATSGLGSFKDFVISNVGESQFSSDYRPPTRRYHALELSLQRRLSDRWQLLGSFISSRQRGDYDGLYDYANSAANPNETYLAEHPVWQHNAFGRLRADRPYQFKIHSSYAFPFGVTVSEGLVYSAGVPISAFAARRLLFGPRGLYLTPRGSMGRTPDHWTLDLHADWRVPVARRRGFEVAVIADVFNATDQHAALDVDEEYFWNGQPEYAQWIAPPNLDERGVPKMNPNLPPSPYYKTPTRYQQPRAVQFGVKLTY